MLTNLMINLATAAATAAEQERPVVSMTLIAIFVVGTQGYDSGFSSLVQFSAASRLGR